MKPPSVEPLGDNSTVIRTEDDPQAYMREVHDIAAVSLAGERDKHIKILAKRKNVRVLDVRKDVDNQRSEFTQQKITEGLEPWSTPVNGEQLLMDIFDCVGKYTWFGNDELANQKRLTVALWVVFSHCFEAFHVAPILAIQSPDSGHWPTWLSAYIWTMTGYQLRQIRIRLRLTQRQFAEALGLADHTSLSRIECGRRCVSQTIATLARMIEAREVQTRASYPKQSCVI